MRILYLCQRVPFPADRGDKIASYNAVRHLARRHEVVVGCLADAVGEIENAKALINQGIDTVAVLHPPLYSRLKVGKALFGKTPFSVAHFHSEELRRRISENASKRPFDVVVAFCSSMAQYHELLPKTPLVADFVDLDSQKWRLYASLQPWPKSSLYAAEERRLLAWERTVAEKAVFTLVRTAAELDDCRRLLPSGRFEILSNGVDLDYFRMGPPKPPSREIIFTGVMDYFPNIEGVCFFAERILPLIHRDMPDATFTIVGSRPMKSVRRLARHARVTVTGAVPDVRPYLHRATIAVAPLRLARGVQNKVLEALATATPAVISAAAAKGIDAADGEGFRVADEPEHFAATVVSLLRQPDVAEELGRKGRRLVERRYVWQQHLDRLESFLMQAAKSPQGAVGT